MDLRTTAGKMHSIDPSGCYIVHAEVLLTIVCGCGALTLICVALTLFGVQVIEQNKDLL
jgi:hypothetical protein